MSYELQGILYKVFPTESKNDSFKTRDFVVKTEEQYPQFIKIQLMNENCGLVEYIPVGSEVKVSFNLRGREWEGKFFMNAQAWKIVVLKPGKNPDPEIIEAEEVDKEPPF